MSNQDKVVLITGASAGIGKATAEAFIKQGSKVVLVARRLDAMQAILDSHGVGEDRGFAFSCDVADESSVDALYGQIKDRFGRLDVLFNNAGMGTPPTRFGDLDYATFRQVVDVNLNGMFLMANRAFRMMSAQDPQGGRIVNNGSISAYVPRPGSAPYTATKHAVTGLTRSISLDGRDLNIACGQIDIGNAATEMTARMADGVPQADWSIAAEPTFDVNHVADAVVNMASLPLDTNVQFMTIMATTMPYIARG